MPHLFWFTSGGLGFFGSHILTKIDGDKEVEEERSNGTGSEITHGVRKASDNKYGVVSPWSFFLIWFFS